MNPLLILAMLGAGAYALFATRKSSPSEPRSSASVKTPIGNVTATSPSAEHTDSGTIIILPATTITAGPSDTSIMLTPDEQQLLIAGTPDQIYDAASVSGHQAFVAAAGLVLSGKGDYRGSELAQQVKDWGG